MQARPITCNACGADRFVAESQVDGWNIGHCADCGLVFVNPIPFFDPTDEFSEISKGFEYTEYMHGPLTDHILEFERRQFKENAAEVERLTGGIVGTGSRRRFLDIGCGSGASVKAATDLGWQATGLDLDPQLIEHGRKELGVDLRCTSVTASDLPAGSFDFIKLRDVAEHLPNPLEVFTRIKELLAPDGVFLLITPNEGGIATQARLVLRRPRKLVATVPPPHHLHSFTSRTLSRTLRRAGLNPGKTFTTSPTNWRYVTSHNMARAQSHAALRPMWATGTALGMGAVLVCWIRPS
jgi:2-polyprenyl-3-methyl-5-hydroxy-6-metoxy-1,4-benzoquinol methylase